VTGGSDKDPFATGGGLDILSVMETDREDGFIDRTLGDYRISGLVAEGGIGRVYRATRIDGSFAREVTVKISPVSGMDARRSFYE